MNEHPFQELIKQTHVEVNLIRAAKGLPPIVFRDSKKIHTEEEVIAFLRYNSSLGVKGYRFGKRRTSRGV